MQQAEGKPGLTSGAIELKAVAGPAEIAPPAPIATAAVPPLRPLQLQQEASASPTKSLQFMSSKVPPPPPLSPLPPSKSM